MKLLFPIVVKQACSCMKIILCGKRYGFFFFLSSFLEIVLILGRILVVWITVSFL